MTDKDIAHHRQPAFDKDDDYSGQNYTLDEERKLGERLPAGSVAPAPSRVTRDDPALPPDNGKRASFDPVTGEVCGSGAGAGGGNPGEDFEADSSGGDGQPLTGRDDRRD